MKNSVYQQRKHRMNKGGRYPIEDRDMVHSLKCTIKLSPYEKDRLIERAETARLSLSAFMRKAALGARIYQRFNDEERKWMRDASNWFNNLNQFNRNCRSYGIDTEMLKMLITLIDSTESKIEDITRTLKHIKDNILKLTLYCGKADYYKEGFMNYLLKIDNTSEAFNKMDEVFDYLKSSLQTEIGYWKESEVEAKVLRWMLASQQQSSHTPANTLQDHPTSGYGSKPTWSTSGMSAFDIVKKNAKDRVKNSAAGEEKLKEVLMSLIDQFPDIITVIESEL